MNEKIKKLAEQSGVDFSVPIFSDNDKGSEFRNFDMEKFAELIIRECADISEDNFHHGFAGAREMKTYFGVE